MGSGGNQRYARTLDFVMKANTMHPDQIAPYEESDLGPYCLQH